MEEKMTTLMTTETVTSLNRDKEKDIRRTNAELDFQKKDKGAKEIESYLNNNSKVNSLFSQNVVLGNLLQVM